MPSGKSVLGFVAAVVVLVGLLSLRFEKNYYAEIYFDIFGLGSDSTIADFRAATNAAQEHWLRKMCNGGRCLHRVDWACGFSISETPHSEADVGSEIFDEKVKACFEMLAGNAPPADTLGKLRLICGRRYMVFVGDQDASPEECTKMGGKWGQKIRVYSDEGAYRE